MAFNRNTFDHAAIPGRLGSKMPLDDNYLEIEQSSLLHYADVDEWLNQNSPSHNSPSPQYKTNTQITQPEASYTDEVTKSQSGTSDKDKPVKVKINLKYCLFVLACGRKSTITRGSNKQKAAAGPNEKFTKLKSDPGKIFFTWKTDQLNLESFKRLSINVIGALDAKEVGEHAQEQEDEGNIIWRAVIPHGGIFAVNQKGALDDSELFAEFLNLCKEPSDGQKYTVTLVQKDPKLVAQKEQALKSLKQKRISSETPDYKPSNWATSSAAVMENMRLLRATHMPCEELTGSSELPVFVDPQDPTQFIPLTVDRVGLWATTMVNNKEVTLYNPPKSPPFNFVTRASSQARFRSKSLVTPSQTSSRETPPSASTKGGPVNISLGALSPTIGGQSVSMPYPYFMGMPYMPFGFPPIGHFPANYPFMPLSMTSPVSFGSHANNPTTSNGQLPSSPAPSNDNTDLDDYLRFAQVDPNCPEVRGALNELGITHYTGFGKVTKSELKEHRIKLVPARSLVSSLKRFKRRLNGSSSRAR